MWWWRAQARVAVQFTDYASVDPGPIRFRPTPIGAARQQRRPACDRHRPRQQGCTKPPTTEPDGSWRASGGAVFHPRQQQRAAQRRSRAGPTPMQRACPSFRAGALRRGLAGPGGIRHALRFTVMKPYAPRLCAEATHWASSNTSPDLPPMWACEYAPQGLYAIPARAVREAKPAPSLTALKTTE